MILKEELEVLRGAPIEVFDGDPMAIPCIEMSDAEKLCKHPVVSVQMCTYNHEPYIRQAIEGVMMQKTDFEFELVIGEDCSQDKTREICFEYQKKHPDKIRVLWWRENVSKLGGNSRRVQAHCRGEFIAFCEGDDYWIDPLKLQKQVDVMRKYPNVGFCFCGAKMRWFGCEKLESWNNDRGHVWDSGIINGELFFLTHIFGVSLALGHCLASSMLMTATVVVRKRCLEDVRIRYADLFSYKLFLGDSTLWLAISSISDVFYLTDEVSVYRQVQDGQCQRLGYRVHLDGILVRLYYISRLLKLKLRHVCVAGFDDFVIDQGKILQGKCILSRFQRMATLITHFPGFVFNLRYVLAFCSYLIIGFGGRRERITRKLLRMTKRSPISRRLKQTIANYGHGEYKS